MTTKRKTTRPKVDVVVQAPVSDLSEWDRNPRAIEPERFASLTRSMTEDPEMLLARPLIALRDGRVIAGNMRLRAAKQLGWKKIATVYVDIEDSKAATWALRDNNPYGQWDGMALAGLLNELNADGIDTVELAGFALEDLALLDGLDFELPDGFDGPLDGDEDGEDRGTSLAVSDVSLGEPENPVLMGDIWALGDHLLVCAGVYDGWQLWAPLLEEGSLFVPYPSPTVPLSSKASEFRLVMVQPDAWMAGHTLDKYASVKGKHEVKKVSE